MAERRAVVASKIGLHAQAGGAVRQGGGQAAGGGDHRQGRRDPVDAASILDVVTLDVRGGEEVILTAEGDGAEQALDELVEVVETDHDAK